MAAQGVAVLVLADAVRAHGAAPNQRPARRLRRLPFWQEMCPMLSIVFLMLEMVSKVFLMLCIFLYTVSEVFLNTF